MAITVNVNGVPIQYPQTGDTNWADDATNFAIQTSAALSKIGLSSGTSVDITQTLDVTGNTTLDANLSVGGNASVTGNALVSGTLGITGDISVNTNKFNITASSGNTSIEGTLGVTGDVAINTNKFNVTASSGNTTIAGTLDVTGNTNIDGVIYADNSTTANTPVISFTGDTNTGIGRSAADTLDFITNGNSRFRIESTGQLKAVVPGGSTLYPGFLCRAWVNFDGTLSNPISPRASGNVSSITDNGTGDYTINFTTAMPDANYNFVFGAQDVGRYQRPTISGNYLTNPTVSALRINVDRGDNSTADIFTINVAVFR